VVLTNYAGIRFGEPEPPAPHLFFAIGLSTSSSLLSLSAARIQPEVRAEKGGHGFALTGSFKLKADHSIFLVRPLPYAASDGMSRSTKLRSEAVRTTILAAATALAMIVAAAPTFAASSGTNGGTQAQSQTQNSFSNNSNQERQCAEAGRNCATGF